MRSLPPAVRFMLLHGALGFGISVLFTVALLVANPGGIATLLLAADTHPLPVLLLWFLCGLTFGSVQIGAAVMLQEDRADDDPPGGTRIPVLVRARRR